MGTKWRRSKLGRTLFWSFVIGVLLKLTQCAPYDQYRRCRNLSIENRTIDRDTADTNTTTSLLVSHALQDYYDSVCEMCQKRDTTVQTLKFLANKTRAVVLLTHQTTFEKLIIAAAGLLTSGSRVTIITGPNIPEHHRIQQLLFQHIPCEKHIIASVLLTFKSFSMEESQICPSIVDSTISPGDIILCSMQNAVQAVEALLALMATSSQPGVLVLDATSVAGLLVAERELIPTLMILENAGDFLRQALGAHESRTGSLFSPRVWYNKLLTGIQDRLNSLDLTSSFVALNRVRSRLQLARVRHIADLWRAGGNIVLTSDSDARRWQYTKSSIHIGSSFTALHYMFGVTSHHRPVYPDNPSHSGFS
jgi:hypothetical protein